MSINIDGSCNNCVLTIGGGSSNSTSCCDSCASGGTCESAKARMCMDMVTVHFDQFSTGDTALQFPGFNMYNDLPITNPLMIFDSAAPTAGIERLGTQNQTIGGGPGIGAAGEAGQPGENAIPQYKILIISANPPTPLTPTPEPTGGLITLEFYDDVSVREVHLLNVTTPCTQLQTFDFNNNVLATKYAVPLGLNSFQIVSFESDACNEQSAVRKLTIKLMNDAAICKIIYDQCLNPALPCVEKICENWDLFIEGATNMVFPGGSVTSDSPVLNPVMIFNSSIPTAGQTQLGTPNILVVPPGPGIGTGGEPGQPGQNLFDLGHVLIISADANPLIPNAAASGQFIFTFTNPVLLKEVDFLNADIDGTTIELFDDGGIPIDFINVLGFGVNSVQKVQTTLPYLTKTMIITIVSTTAITKICYAMCEGGGSFPIPPDVIDLPDNAFTSVDIPSTVQQGTYMLVVKSVNPDGASATFMASSAYNAQAGSVARITSAPSITDETVNILWPPSSKVQLYHDTLKTGGVGALIPYNVRITTI